MVKSAVVLAFKLFSKAKSIFFLDKSQIQYTLNNVYHIHAYAELPIMMMIKEGMTWYEKHLHAKPVNDWTKARENIALYKDEFKKLDLRNFATHGTEYWKKVSPDKNIFYSEWYIERGANRIAFKLQKKKTCKPFLGGYWRGGIILGRT